MRTPKPQLGLGIDLLDSASKQKALALRRKQVAELFGAYCSDVRTFVQELAGTIKGNGMVGLHPFMVADAYDGKLDKIVAVLMSALIPMKRVGLLERVGMMRRLLGGSPTDFISGRYKIIDYAQFYKGVGCTQWQLQQWADIIYKSLMGGEDMLLSNIGFYKESEGFNGTPAFEDSYSEAVFWLSERFLGVDPPTIPLPRTRSVRELLRALVPREKMIGHDEAASFFRLEYPAKIWYAACGRDILYQTHYDDIYKMERNLKKKFTRGTYMDRYERWRFRTLFLKPLYKDLEEMQKGQGC